jgi:hypothetical protein
MRGFIMNVTYLDYAKCMRGHSTPIRPSKPATIEEDQKSREMDAELLFVACSKCNLVYTVETRKLETGPSTSGLSPYHEGAPLHVYQVPIECDDLSCETPAIVLAVRNSDTTAEDLEKEKRGWRWADLKCPNEHEILWPPFH